MDDDVNSEGFKRRLSAILSADVVEYNRFMNIDEASTVKTLTTYREIMAPLIKQHRGRVVDSPVYNILAEFSSMVVEPTYGAIEPWIINKGIDRMIVQSLT